MGWLRGMLGGGMAMAFALHAGAQTDVGNFFVQKAVTYDQTSASAVVIDPERPYLFSSQVATGTTGEILPTTALTLPGGATGTVSYQDGAGGLQFAQYFTSQGALDAAFPAGTYDFTIQTSTPNTYSTQIAEGADNFPAIPQITSASNAAWSSNGILVVTDYTQKVVLTWNNPSGAIASFGAYAGSTSFNSSASGNLTTTYTIPAGQLANNTFYQCNVDLYNPSSNTTLGSANGNAGSNTEVSFILQTGTPNSSSTGNFVVEKEQILFQASNNPPVYASGDVAALTPAPYNLYIQTPVTGTVTGPSSTSFPLTPEAGGSKFRYRSAALASQALLNSLAPDGTFTFPGGTTVSLTGDSYPAVAQILLVNGATPVWDAQGQLALDPAATNTITWSAVSVPNFSTDGHENAEIDSNGATVLQAKAGVAQSSTTAFTTLVVAAGLLTSPQTYVGEVDYGQASTATSSGSNLFAALYDTENLFAIVALKPQTITFAAISPQTNAGSLNLSATSSSGLAVSYTVLSGPATVSGHTLTFTGTGTVTIEASQGGNGTYASAANVTQSFAVTYVGAETPTLPPWGLGVLGLLLMAAAVRAPRFRRS